MRSEVIILAALLGATGSSSAWAYSGGVGGYSGQGGPGCMSCHSGGQAPAVLIDGPSQVITGGYYDFTFTILGGPAVAGGLNVALAGDGTLVAGSDTRFSGEELVQLSPKPFASGGTVSWTFSVMAGADGGDFTLYASGLSANGDGMKAGDNGAQTTLAVTVIPGIPDSGPPDAGAPPDAGSRGDGGAHPGDGGSSDAGAPHRTPTVNPNPAPVDEASWGTGCGAAVAGPFAPLLLLCLSLLRKRRAR